MLLLASLPEKKKSAWICVYICELEGEKDFVVGVAIYHHSCRRLAHAYCRSSISDADFKAMFVILREHTTR